MDLPKLHRYKGCCSTSVSSNKNQEKENISGRTETYTQGSSKCCTGTARSTNAKKEVLPSHGMLSSAALVAPERKLKTVVTRSKGDGSSRATRPVLRDLDKNISKRDTRPATNIHALESVLLKDIYTETFHNQKKLQSERVTKTLSAAKTSTCCSTYTNLTDSEKLQPGMSSRLRIPSAGNKLTITQQMPKANTPVTVSKLEKVTLRSKITPQQPQIWNQANNCEAEEIFIDSSKHYITFTPAVRSRYQIKVTPNKPRSISPIESSVKMYKSTVIFQGISEGVRRPAVKLTLMQKKHPEFRKDNSAAYSLDIYQMEYLDDIVYCELKNDWKYILKVKSITLHNMQNLQNRATVVNWLIQANDYLDLSSSVLFASIRLFDKVLDSTSITCNTYQLVGLVILWIMSKFEEKTVLKCSKMLSLCKDVYPKQDFLKMEKKLLSYFNFDLKIPSIPLYTTYYFKKLNIESDQLRYTALYILECYTLRAKFSTVIPSIQAAAAVRLTLNILHPLLKVWKRLEKAIGYYSEEELQNIMHEMLLQLRKMQDLKYQYRQPYKKYAAKDKLEVSILVMNKLAAVSIKLFN